MNQITLGKKKEAVRLHDKVPRSGADCEVGTAAWAPTREGATRGVPLFLNFLFKIMRRECAFKGSAGVSG